MDDEIDFGYIEGEEFPLDPEDENYLADYDEGELLDGHMIQQPEDEQFNYDEESQNFMVQGDFVDLEIEEELAIAGSLDPEEADIVERAEVEMAMTEEAVPYDWQYWEHDADTIPPVDESTAPPLESGWVDPDTGEMIP